MARRYVVDSMAGVNWTPFTSHTIDQGGPATNHPSESGAWYIYGGKALCRTPGLVYYDGTPLSANYTVYADVYILTSTGSTGVAGRISTTAQTYYTAYFEKTTNKVVLAKRVNGAITTLGVTSAVYSGYHYLELDMNGTTIRALVDGVQVLSVTDSSITAAGKGGIRAPVVSDYNTGKHIGYFEIYDATSGSGARSFVV
jgi:hypothetical protein